MAIVFQYGSNCMDSEINGPERLCGEAKFLDIAETVEDFALVFDVWSKGRGCAAADIVRKPGGKVWGVLYEVPDDLIRRETAKVRGGKSFDAIDGEGTNYKRESIDVRRPEGGIVTALTYTVVSPKPALKTSGKYVGYIVAGLRQRGVKRHYIEQVKAIALANNPAISTEADGL
jgi:hypothetical protein